MVFLRYESSCGFVIYYVYWNSSHRRCSDRVFSPVWTRLWTIKEFGLAKLFPQWEHRYGFSPVWVLSWQFRLNLWRNRLSQCLHWYGFSPECIFWCDFRPLESIKVFPHSLHWYGLSLVWTRTCFFRWGPWLKLFSQWGHLYGLSPVWIRLWASRLALVLKYLSHSLQWKDFSSWVFKWTFSLEWIEKTFPHCSQLNRFSMLCSFEWSLLSSLVGKLMLHILQVKYFCSVCLLSCFLK